MVVLILHTLVCTVLMLMMTFWDSLICEGDRLVNLWRLYIHLFNLVILVFVVVVVVVVVVIILFWFLLLLLLLLFCFGVLIQSSWLKTLLYSYILVYPHHSTTTFSIISTIFISSSPIACYCINDSKILEHLRASFKRNLSLRSVSVVAIVPSYDFLRNAPSCHISGKSGSGRTAAVFDWNLNNPSISVLHAIDER